MRPEQWEELAAGAREAWDASQRLARDPAPTGVKPTEERWGSFADPKWAWAISRDLEVVDGPWFPRDDDSPDTPVWVVPRARAEAAEYDIREARALLDSTRKQLEQVRHSETSWKESEKARARELAEVKRELELTEEARVAYEKERDWLDERLTRSESISAELREAYEAELEAASLETAEYREALERLDFGPLDAVIADLTSISAEAQKRHGVDATVYASTVLKKLREARAVLSSALDTGEPTTEEERDIEHAPWCLIVQNSELPTESPCTCRFEPAPNKERGE